MTPHQSWFTGYGERDGGQVFMESAYNVVGVGLVHIKMFDGLERTFTKIRHIPDMRKSLISLGVLEALGCRFTSCDRVLKVSKGALMDVKIAFLHGELEEQIYMKQLEGFIIKGAEKKDYVLSFEKSGAKLVGYMDFDYTGSVDTKRSTSVMTSIDCGAADSYVDSNFIGWVGDNLYISNGESRVVQNSASVSHVLSTLRVFSTRKKNCYSIQVDKGSQILVRAMFYYGNYDKTSSPPSFDLQFDGNYWATVTTSMDSTEVYEAIYAVKGDTTSVCVAQTKPNQLPFISSLEVRSLDANMYNTVTADYALFLLSRSAFGAKQTVRYSDDSYDRIWTPVAASGSLTTVTSDASFINTNVADNPPSTVLQTALTSATVSNSIVLTAPNLKTEVPVYINAYFSEVAQLGPSDKRSIQVFINNTSSGDPFAPPYESTLEYTFYNITADANTTMTLSATADSTLPPIINALEIFSVSNVLTSGTDSNDVQALSSLQQQFEKLQEWSGDPCLPATFNWEWVACSSHPIPRITALYLNGLQLNGALPDFSALDAVQTIDMHNNSINGEIPGFLGTLPNLKQLNLAGNDFIGPIPTSISNNNKIKLDVSGNPNLCVSGKKCETSSTGTGINTSPGTGTTKLSTGKKKNKLPVILGSSIPSFLVFWAVVGFVVITQKRRKATGQMGGPGKPGGLPVAMTTGPAAQVHAVNGHSPAAQHQTTADDITVDIAQQMGSELDDLFQQQAQENENGNNNN
ncbi:probable LRR receptor-like serine/threonine-protein kinase At1g05700 [Magnolia sinica]|uniref:probable LRR receptor-like serine/threonine-protein kinase At1g05700 n=1 Tax=Magnolia sinica TaxID=86752 RepID=UPI002658F50E|nr:probable LRR receptor-like serine/threonine-protein kinase At1g05700 [Magnolia sinica]